VKVVDPFTPTAEATVNIQVDDGIDTGSNILESGGQLYYATFEPGTGPFRADIKFWKGPLDFATHAQVGSTITATPPVSLTQVPTTGSAQRWRAWIADGTLFWNIEIVWEGGSNIDWHVFQFDLDGGGQSETVLGGEFTAWGHPNGRQVCGAEVGTSWYGSHGADVDGSPNQAASFVYKAVSSATQPAAHWPSTGPWRMDEDNLAAIGNIGELARSAWLGTDGETLHMYAGYLDTTQGVPLANIQPRLLSASVTSIPTLPTITTFETHPTFTVAQFPFMLGPKI
jgi:hypothetical protein